MSIGFDLISDLNLSPEDSFNWENKATSLYCIIAGNISSDIKTVMQTLLHLSRLYQGVFYIPGHLEYEGTIDIDSKTKQIASICSRIKNVAFLNQHVVIINGIAILGCNGWYGTTPFVSFEHEVAIQAARLDDILYLRNSIKKLQKHLDVAKICVVTSSVPDKSLYFGEEPDEVKELMPLTTMLGVDTENKVSHWVYGTYKKIVDTKINDINYLNNSSFKRNPYWAKRIEIAV